MKVNPEASLILSNCAPREYSFVLDTNSVALLELDLSSINVDKDERSFSDSAYKSARGRLATQQEQNSNNLTISNIQPYDLYDFLTKVMKGEIESPPKYDHYRGVHCAYYIENKSVKQISEELGIAEVTVYVDCFRGTKVLCSWLRDYRITQKLVKASVDSMRSPLGEYKNWYSNFLNWLNNQSTPPQNISFDSKKGSNAFKSLLKLLRIEIPSNTIGNIVPNKDHHGFLLDIVDTSGSVKRRYLVALPNGKLLKDKDLISDASKDKIEHEKPNTLLTRLLNSYGPEDLLIALHPRKIRKFSSNPGSKKQGLIDLFNKSYIQQNQVSIPSVIASSFDYIHPDFSGDDLVNGTMKVKLCIQASVSGTFVKLPVINILLVKDETSGKLTVETNYTEDFQETFSQGAITTHKTTKDLKLYLQGKRENPPLLSPLEVVKAASSWNFRMVQLGDPIIVPPSYVGTTLIPKIFLSDDGKKYLGLWEPDADPTKTTPLISLGLNKDKFVKVHNVKVAKLEEVILDQVA